MNRDNNGPMTDAGAEHMNTAAKTRIGDREVQFGAR
jgi:hypothetical protein